MFIQFWSDNFPGIRGKPLVCIGRPDFLPGLPARREALEKRMQPHLDSGEVLSEEQAEQEPSPVQLPDSGELMQYLEQQDRSGILRYLRDYMGSCPKKDGWTGRRCGFCTRIFCSWYTATSSGMKSRPTPSTRTPSPNSSSSWPIPPPST